MSKAVKDGVLGKETARVELLEKLKNPKSVVEPVELIEVLKDLKDEESIKAVAVPFDAWVRSKYSTIKSVRKHMTQFLKPLREIPLVLGENAYIYENYKGEKQQKHLFQKYAGLTRDEYNLLNREAELKKEQRLENGVEIQPQPYLDQVEKLLLANDKWELMVGIIAASGRRPHEIAARGHFKLVDSKDLDNAKHQPSSHWVLFSGQGKKRGVKFDPYPIATLFPAKFMLKALRKLRELPEIKNLVKESESELIKEGKKAELKKLYPEDSAKQAYEWEISINDKINDKVNQHTLAVIKKSLSKVLPLRSNKTSNTASSLRAAYARLATARDCPKNISDLLWAGKLLGHKKNKDLEAHIAQAEANQETTKRREKIEVSDKGSDLKSLLTTMGYFDYIIPDKQVVPLTDTPKMSVETTSIRGFEADADFIQQKQKEWGLGSRAEALERIVELAKVTLDMRSKQFDNPPEEEIVEPAQSEEESKETSQVDEGLVGMTKAELVQLITQVIDQKRGDTNVAADINREKISKQEKENNQQSSEEKDWQDTPSKDLRKSRAPGVALEKCKRIVQAIMDYNDYKAGSNNDRWYIGVRSIQECAGKDGGSGLNYGSVKQFLNEYKVMVDDHNAKHNLKSQHNKRHSKPISEVVEW